MCSEILCYLSKDACSVEVSDAQKLPVQKAPKHPVQDWLLRLEENKQINFDLFGFCGFIPANTLEILYFELGLDTVK